MKCHLMQKPKHRLSTKAKKKVRVLKMTDRDRLIELYKEATTLYLDYLESIDQKGLIDTEGRAKFTADHLLANGVIVPPCKVGDKVYKINGSRIEKFKVARFIISSYGIRAEDLYGVQVALIDDFGKTVFLTKEEAEKALKERGNNA